MKQPATKLGAIFILLGACACSVESAVTFALPLVMPLGGAGGDIAVADIDVDGDIDIISTTRDPDFFWVSFNDGAGNFTPAVQFAAGDSPRAVIVADFNNDGDLDIATANELGGDVTVMAGDGAGGFDLPAHFSTDSRPMDLASGDFNGDGLIDLTVTHRASPTGPLLTLLNSGGIGPQWLGFQPATPYVVGRGSRSVEVVDLDEDGELDIVAANRDDSTVSVFLGIGDGTFNSSRTFFAAAGPRDTVSGDFTGDGLTDLAVADFTLNAMRILKNRGTGVNGWIGLQTLSVWFTSGQGPHGIAAGDLDLDNDLDLVLVNVQSGEIALSVMLNDGSGGFAESTVVSVGAVSAASVALADFDNDGYLDSASTSAAVSGSATVLFNTTDLDPADLNGDGVVDTADLGLLLGAFGNSGAPGTIFADINGDGVVDTADLGILLASFS
jgi:hypothetical protein